MPSQRSQWFARNEQAEQLEAEGERQKALALYEQNAREGCNLSFTYERMATIYRADDRLPEAVEAMEKALTIEKERGPSAKVVRLEKSAKSLRNAAAEAPTRRKTAPRRERTERRATAPSTKGKAAKKGCFSVLLILFSLASLTAFVLI